MKYKIKFAFYHRFLYIDHITGDAKQTMKDKFREHRQRYLRKGKELLKPHYNHGYNGDDFPMNQYTYVCQAWEQKIPRIIAKIKLK